MFSATKLVVAGAIVALFGGFLLAGVLTQPSEELAPAASPTPDLLPGVDLVTEEVEPGVYRVLDDGTGRDMLDVAFGGNNGAQVIAGPDGSVLVHYSEHRERKWLFRVGQEGDIDAHVLEGLTTAPDGTLWVLGSWEEPFHRASTGPEHVSALVDGVWTVHPMPEGVFARGLAVSPDGSIWVLTSTSDSESMACGGRLGVARLIDGQWQQERIEPPTTAGGQFDLAVAPDGTVLLGGPMFPGEQNCHRSGLLWERDEDGWAPPAVFDGAVGNIAVGRDGTAWAAISGGPGRLDSLLRRTSGEWELLGDASSVPGGVFDEVASNFTVSIDGRLWMPKNDCGVDSFDGATWSAHLAGRCVTDVSAAPNGNVWAVVGGEHPEADYSRSDVVGLYVITPEAVASAQSSER